MNKELTIHIPYDLARYAVWQRKLVTRYETNQIIKALDTWLILKSISKPSLIQRWNFQKQYLFTICKTSEVSFRSRLKLLQKIGLLTFDRNNIRLCSWEQLSLRFEIDITQKFTVKYNPDDNKRIQDWIIATEIKDNQSRQTYSIFKKLKENPVLMMKARAAMLKAGADSKQLNKTSYFLTWLMVCYLQDFIWESEVHDLFIEVRPDTNRGVITMADHWKCKSATTVTYWKKILEKTGIVYISKLQVESQDRVRNKDCKVLWLKKPKQTLLCLCDNIQILTPWITLNSHLTDNTNNAEFSITSLSA